MLRDFFRAFWAQWFTRMSGPLTVPVAAAAFFVSAMWQKVAFAGLAIMCALVTCYKIWEAEKRTTTVLRKRIADLEWSPDRPKLSFVRWGQVDRDALPDEHHPAMNFQKGFYLQNDGGPALAVTIHDFQVGSETATSITLPRIQQDSVGFVPAYLSSGNPVFKWDLLGAMRTAAELAISQGTLRYGQEYAIPLRVEYRDFNNVGYLSHQELMFHHLYSRISFRPVSQTRLSLPDDT